MSRTRSGNRVRFPSAGQQYIEDITEIAKRVAKERYRVRA
jgi:hypothetical protein